MATINVYYSDLKDGIVNEQRLFDLIELGIAKIETKTNFVKLDAPEGWLIHGLYKSIYD